MMAAVVAAALTCFIVREVLWQPMGQISQCNGGRIVPIEFAIVDAKTGSPVPRAKLTLSGRSLLHHDLETGPDGRAFLRFQPGCDELAYAYSGIGYTVHYSNWGLGIEAEGYESVRDPLSSHRGDTRYAHDAVPPPIVIRITRRMPTP
jgi:hypothetical protein